MFKQFINYQTLSKQMFSNSNFQFTVSRDTILSTFAIDCRYFTHNGQQFKSILVKPYHVAFKLGQFIYTRLQTSKIHLRKRKKKERKKRGK